VPLFAARTWASLRNDTMGLICPFRGRSPGSSGRAHSTLSCFTPRSFSVSLLKVRSGTDLKQAHRGPVRDISAPSFAARAWDSRRGRWTSERAWSTLCPERNRAKGGHGPSWERASPSSADFLAGKIKRPSQGSPGPCGGVGYKNLFVGMFVL